MKTIVQIVHGRLSRKKLAKYSVMNMEWLCNRNKFAGRGMSRRGKSHCKQYIVQYQHPQEHFRGSFLSSSPAKNSTTNETCWARTLEILIRTQVSSMDGGKASLITSSSKENRSAKRTCYISELPFASVSKRVQVHSLSYGNEFYLQVYCLANQTHFHMKGCAPGLVLKQRKRQLENGLLKTNNFL